MEVILDGSIYTGFVCDCQLYPPHKCDIVKEKFIMKILKLSPNIFKSMIKKEFNNKTLFASSTFHQNIHYGPLISNNKVHLRHL